MAKCPMMGADYFGYKYYHRVPWLPSSKNIIYCVHKNMNKATEGFIHSKVVD